MTATGDSFSVFAAAHAAGVASSEPLTSEEFAAAMETAATPRYYRLQCPYIGLRSYLTDSLLAVCNKIDNDVPGVGFWKQYEGFHGALVGNVHLERTPYRVLVDRDSGTLSLVSSLFFPLFFFLG